MIWPIERKKQVKPKIKVSHAVAKVAFCPGLDAPEAEPGRKPLFMSGEGYSTVEARERGRQITLS